MCTIHNNKALRCKARQIFLRPFSSLCLLLITHLLCLWSAKAATDIVTKKSTIRAPIYFTKIVTSSPAIVKRLDRDSFDRNESLKRFDANRSIQLRENIKKMNRTERQKVMPQSRGIAKITPISIQSSNLVFDVENRSIDKNSSEYHSKISEVYSTNTNSLQISNAIKMNSFESNEFNEQAAKIESNSSRIRNFTNREPKSFNQLNVQNHSALNNDGLVIDNFDSETNSEFDQINSNLCFLSHGGSSETFTVNEATPIETVIGTIKVNLFQSFQNQSIDSILIVLMIKMLI